MYKIVLLDIDDTILDFKECEKNAILKTMTKYGVCPNDELINNYSMINKNLWELFEKKEITKSELLIKRFELFFKPLGVVSDFKQINETYLNYLSNEVIFVKDAKKFCEKLKSKYNVYVVTNAVKKTQEKRLLKAEILKYFDGVFVSEDIGYQKPDYKFFEHIYNKIDKPKKNEIIILGDSKTSDIQGGINFEIATCWFNKNDRDEYPNIKPNYEIKNLMDFFNVVD